MNGNIHHGIVYGEQDLLLRKSCIIFNSQYCLAPASILLNSFAQMCNDVQNNVNHNLHHDLKINRIIDTTTDRRYHILKNYTYKVIHEQNDNLYKSNAFIVNIFKCRNIWNSFNDILRGFVARSAKSENNDLHKLLFSCFVILRLKVFDSAQSVPAPLAVFEQITKSILRNNLHQTMSNNNSQNVNAVFKMKEIRKMENIESISTPFGNECFLNTINVGRIANIFGDSKCLMVASMPLVNGCEGGAVYNRKHELIGIVISTTFDWNSENATLTLVAKFDEIMAEFVSQTQLTMVNIENGISNNKCMNQFKNDCAGTICPKDSFALENFIVLIQSADSWGSGCFVKINDTRMIITCAHVLENHTGNVQCTWKFGNFSSHVIFKNPNFDEAFDIAILEAPKSIPDKYFTQCHTIPTRIGQTVYSSGFPHFTSLGKACDFFPSIFEGRITKISKGVIFTDASVQSGQSGGPMFGEDGRLIGICVSNSKDDTYQLIYPNINMSVPVYDILPILEKYGTTKDKRDLHHLVANKEIKGVWALETPKILCKL